MEKKITMNENVKAEDVAVALARPATVEVIAMDGESLVVRIPLKGTIAAKEGKETHVIVSDRMNVPRADGKAVSVQINGWYK